VYAPLCMGDLRFTDMNHAALSRTRRPTCAASSSPTR
jgi:hypothetical protein